MIISGGENIYPAEIENALAAHPDVAECAVVGVADARWGEAVVAAVVPRTAARWTPRRCRAGCQRVARYKLPRRYVALAALPKTALGKVQKKSQRC
jgi:fatty-acyl-CoA synthase